MSTPVFTSFKKEEVTLHEIRHVDDKLDPNNFFAVSTDPKHVHQHLGGSKRAVFATRDKVSLTDSVKTVNQRGKSVWSTWRTVQSIGFYRNASGHLQPYAAFREGNGKGWSHVPSDIVWDTINPSASTSDSKSYTDLLTDGASEAFRNYAHKMLGVKSFLDIYPRAEDFGLIHYKYLPKTIRTAFRAEDTKEMSDLVFGRKRRDSRLLWSLENSEPLFIELAHSLRGIVSDSALAVLMDNRLGDDMIDLYNGSNSADVRHGMSYLSKSAATRMASNTIDSDALRAIFAINRNGSVVPRTMAMHLGGTHRDVMNGKVDTGVAEKKLRTWTDLTEGLGYHFSGRLTRPSTPIGNSMVSLSTATAKATSAVNRLSTVLTATP